MSLMRHIHSRSELYREIDRLTRTLNEACNELVAARTISGRFQEVAAGLDTAHRAALHDLDAARREITRLELVVATLDLRQPSVPNAHAVKLHAEPDSDRCG